MKKYEIIFSDEAQKDLKYWKKKGQVNALKKIQALLDDLELHPEYGIGKPEKLKHHLSGFWSRRIDYKNRIIYSINNSTVIVYVVSARGHY
jgi:toxin YoeB